MSDDPSLSEIIAARRAQAALEATVYQRKRAPGRHYTLEGKAMLTTTQTLVVLYSTEMGVLYATPADEFFEKFEAVEVDLGALDGRT